MTRIINPRWLSALVLTAILAIAQMATAQSIPSSSNTPATDGQPLKVQQHRKDFRTKLKEELNLTKEQNLQIKQIRKANQDKLKADRNSLRSTAIHSAERKAASSQLRADQEAMMLQIRGVLTPGQQVKFDKMMEHRKSEHQK